VTWNRGVELFFKKHFRNEGAVFMLCFDAQGPLVLVCVHEGISVQRATMHLATTTELDSIVYHRAVADPGFGQD